MCIFEYVVYCSDVWLYGRMNLCILIYTYLDGCVTAFGCVTVLDMLRLFAYVFMGMNIYVDTNAFCCICMWIIHVLGCICLGDFFRIYVCNDSVFGCMYEFGCMSA